MNASSSRASPRPSLVASGGLPNPKMKWAFLSCFYDGSTTTPLIVAYAWPPTSATYDSVFKRSWTVLTGHSLIDYAIRGALSTVRLKTRNTHNDSSSHRSYNHNNENRRWVKKLCLFQWCSHCKLLSWFSLRGNADVGALTAANCCSCFLFSATFGVYLFTEPHRSSSDRSSSLAATCYQGLRQLASQ